MVCVPEKLCGNFRKTRRGRGSESYAAAEVLLGSNVYPKNRRNINTKSGLGQKIEVHAKIGRKRGGGVLKKTLQSKDDLLMVFVCDL